MTSTGPLTLLSQRFLLAVGLLQEAASVSELVGVLPIVAGLVLALRPGR